MRAVVAVLPISDARIWQYSNCDDFLSNLTSFFSQSYVPVYDFNLLKTRFQRFNDKTSYENRTHLSGIGAAQFSLAFCEVMKTADSGKNTDSLFYPSYGDMKKDSPYMANYSANK